MDASQPADVAIEQTSRPVRTRERADSSEFGDGVQPKRKRLGWLALGALGIVFGDIGTSPLYAFRQCFLVGHAPYPSTENVLDITSLIVWTLLGVVCIKYATFVLRANHDGEGGTLALLALLHRASGNVTARSSGLALLILFGTAMLYGDGVITPAISVLSALEGLDVVTKAAHPIIVPVTIGILIALFALQRFGTGKIGGVFGPVMLLWFASITAFGVLGILAHPEVLGALDPRHAVSFAAQAPLRWLFVMGAVVLCVSGVEAMYADLAHFGIGPIRVAWYLVVFPALAVNYLGQGGLVMSSRAALDSPFFGLVPAWAIIPEVALATAATVIASQALIAGAFSLTQQAVQLGYLPRMTVEHKSKTEHGQIFLPLVNVLLAIACVALVATFRSSDKLADAYGLAVTLTMLTTTIGFAALAHSVWKWPLLRIIPLVAFFLLFDLSFFVGNIPKLPTGGWIPALIAISLYTLFTTFNDGRFRHAQTLAAMEMPIRTFLKQIAHREKSVVRGTAVFVTAHPEGIPYALSHQWLRSHVIFESIVLLTVVYERRPYVDVDDRVFIAEIEPGLLYRVTAHYGFMQMPSVEDILLRCKETGKGHHFEDATYFLSDPTIVQGAPHHRLATWRRILYAFMVRNAKPLTDSIGLPPSRVVRLGVEIPV